MLRPNDNDTTRNGRCTQRPYYAKHDRDTKFSDYSDYSENSDYSDHSDHSDHKTTTHILHYEDYIN
jgi:hypothetical protein